MENRRQDPTLLWQVFGSATGVTRYYPGGRQPISPVHSAPHAPPLWRPLSPTSCRSPEPLWAKLSPGSPTKPQAWPVGLLGLPTWETGPEPVASVTCRVSWLAGVRQ